MNAYSKLIEKEYDTIAKLEKKLNECKGQSANEIAELTAEIKYQREVLTKFIELYNLEELLNNLKAGHNNC